MEGEFPPWRKHCKLRLQVLGEVRPCFITVQSTEVIGAPTVPVDIPTREETTQAFAEVSSVLRSVSTQHDEVRAGMQSLVSGVETLQRARVVDEEKSAQVQATLERTLSVSSSLEARLEQAEVSQAQARTAAAEAHISSQRALQQAARLQEEQTKISKQLQQSSINSSAAGADFHHRGDSSRNENSKTGTNTLGDRKESGVHGPTDCGKSGGTSRTIGEEATRATIPGV